MAKVKSINTVAPINLSFAKLMTKKDGDKRLKIYYKMSSLLRNKFSLMETLDRLWNIESNDGKNPDEPAAIAISSWMYSLEKGQSFAQALDGWAPLSERLMLIVGDVSKLDIALTNVIKVSEGTKKITGPLISALSYPTFLMLLCVLILVMVGLYLVPPMTKFAGNAKWGGTAGSLVALSDFVANYWKLMPVVILGTVATVVLTLPILGGSLRVLLDKMPPWSLYRMFAGVGWLMSLAALVQAGTPIAKAMEILRDNSTVYLKERIDKTLVFMQNGYNLGISLKMTGLGFPDPELIGDLCIYSELDNFEEALNKLADDYLENSIEKVKVAAALLNSLAMLMVSGIIAWVLLGVFDMQNQVQNAM